MQVNAWVLSDGPNTTHDGRWQNYSWPGLNYNAFDHGQAPSYGGSSQNSLLMVNGRNFEITDCDLFADGDVLQFYSPGYAGGTVESSSLLFVNNARNLYEDFCE